MRQQAADQRRHQRALGSGERFRADLMPDQSGRGVHGRLVEHLHGEADHQRCHGDANEQSDLLVAGRGANQKSSLQILRGGAGVRRRDADHAAHAEGHRLVDVARPPDAEKEQAGRHQRGDGHPGDGVRARPDQPDDAGSHGDEEETEDDDQDAQQKAAAEVAGKERQQRHDEDQRQAAEDGDAERQVALGAGGARGAGAAAQRSEASFEAGHDRRKRLEQRDEPARRHRTRANLAHVGEVDGAVELPERVRRGIPAVGARLADVGEVSELHQLRGDDVGRHQRRDQRNDPEPRQHAPGDEHAGDPRSDDVADAHVLRSDRGIHGRRGKDAARRARHVAGHFRDHLEDLLQDCVADGKEQAHVRRARHLAATLAGDQHLRAGGALGIRQVSVLLHDQCAPQRHHHQDAQHSAEQSQREDGPVGEVTGADALPAGGIDGEEEEPWEGEDDARRDALARRPDGLDDVVLEDRGSAELLQKRDGKDGDGDRGAHRQPRLQRKVHGGRAEDESEERADDHRFRRELGDARVVRNVRLVVRNRRDAFGHVRLLARAAVEYPRREPEVNVAGSRLLDLLADRHLEVGVRALLDVHATRAGCWAFAPVPRRLPPLLLALLLEDPRWCRFTPLRDEPPRGGASGGECDQVDRRLAPVPPARFPAAIQRVPCELDHCACLDQSAEFHVQKVVTPPPARRAPAQPAPVRRAPEGAASAGRWRRDRSRPGAPDALRGCAHPAAGRNHRFARRTSR